MSGHRLLEGDCLERLAEVPDGTVQTCVTSPPYFGLRSYDVGDAEIGREQYRPLILPLKTAL